MVWASDDYTYERWWLWVCAKCRNGNRHLYGYSKKTVNVARTILCQQQVVLLIWRLVHFQTHRLLFYHLKGVEYEIIKQLRVTFLSGKFRKQSGMLHYWLRSVANHRQRFGHLCGKCKIVSAVGAIFHQSLDVKLSQLGNVEDIVWKAYEGLEILWGEPHHVKYL